MAFVRRRDNFDTIIKGAIPIEEERFSAVLVGVECKSDRIETLSDQSTMEELGSLVETAGGEVTAQVFQSRETPDPATYIGEGKLEEIRMFVRNTGAQLVVFDNELSPSQIGNIEQAVEAKVLDRSMLILDIFAQHAVTLEGKIQVELAQQRYTLPRLMGARPELSRLGGGIGTRGPGESKLELDRRYVKLRISALKTQLAEIKKNRDVQRRARTRSAIPKVAIIGYTNAGKSTLLNALTDAGVLTEDKLFATLDPTTRKFHLDENTDILLTDTVGFIRNLPHHLIEAFSSTLEELKYADLLLHMIDVSNPEWASHVAVAEGLIRDLGAERTPVLKVFNKADLCPANLVPVGRDSVLISAKNQTGFDQLRKKILEKLEEGNRELTVLIPYAQSGLLDQIHSACKILERSYEAEGTKLRLSADAEMQGRLEPYLMK